VPWPARRLAIEPLARLVPNSIPRRSRLSQIRRFLDVADNSPAGRYLRWVGYFSPEAKAMLYTAEFRRELAGYEAAGWFSRLWDDRSLVTGDPVDTASAVDVESYLPYDLLVKMDIATMANSLEARSPFLDHEVMEFCARLPSTYKIRGTTLKYLLKRAAGGLLPGEVRRRRKMGFGVPVGDWMRGAWRPWVEDVLLSPQALKRGLFQPEALRRLVKAHLEGHRDQSSTLWSLLCLELWYREFLH
jgi:asparagine synthase (glutamine-hydrolysing)